MGFNVVVFLLRAVLSTYQEPVPGWTDNLYGPSGLCVAVARGYAHVLHGRGNRRANLVPVDYCVNALIATAWDINRRFVCTFIYPYNSRSLFNICAARFEKRLIDHAEMPVYNYMFDKNNLTWGRYMHLVKKGLHDPLDKAVWYDFRCFATSAYGCYHIENKHLFFFHFHTGISPTPSFRVALYSKL